MDSGSGSQDTNDHQLNDHHLETNNTNNLISNVNNVMMKTVAVIDDHDGGEFSETPGGSFPKEIGFPIYDNEPSADANGALLTNEGEAKPRILLMGLRRYN